MVTDEELAMLRFQLALEQLIRDYLVEEVTADDINKFYGYRRDCQIAKFYKQVAQRHPDEDLEGS